MTIQNVIEAMFAASSDYPGNDLAYSILFRIAVLIA